MRYTKTLPVQLEEEERFKSCETIKSDDEKEGVCNTDFSGDDSIGSRDKLHSSFLTAVAQLGCFTNATVGSNL